MSVYERIKYNKCPLVEVTYQVNYPAILAIDANDPVAFQEIIRGKYPNYDLKIEQQNELTVNIENSKPDAILNSRMVRKLHNFISEDQKWRVTLAKDMLAFTTVEYKYWEDMTARAFGVIKALEEVYHPAYYTRIGLRYIDAIDKDSLGLTEVPWNELIKPHLCGCLGYAGEGINVRSSAVNSEISFGDIFVNVASGTGFVDKHDGNPPQEAFILNCDYFFGKKIKVTDLTGISSRLHEQSHLFFRDSITNRLHEAMEPEELKL